MSSELEALRQELTRLADRLAALEKKAAVAGDIVKGDGAAVRAAATPTLSEELIVVIGAAVAAYLGKTAPIRQIRLLSTSAWAQQGRVLIQASHSL